MGARLDRASVFAAPATHEPAPRPVDLGDVRRLAAKAERLLEALRDGSIDAAPQTVAAIEDGVERLLAALESAAEDDAAVDGAYAEARNSLGRISGAFERARAELEDSLHLAPESAGSFERLAGLALEPPRQQQTTRISALIVECAGVFAALPARSVVEALRGGARRVERADGALSVRVQGRALRLASLAELMKLQGAREGAEGVILAVRAGDAVFALSLDRVHGVENVSVEPGARSRIYAGAARLADGGAMVLLSMKGLAEAVCAAPAGSKARAKPAAPAVPAARVALLMFRGAGGAVQALPLSLVARIETTRDVTCEDGRWSASLNGALVPVLDGAGRTVKPPEGAQLLILARNGREIALLAEEVLEVAEGFADAPLLRNEGGAGGLRLNGRTAELVEVELLWRRVV